MNYADEFFVMLVFMVTSLEVLLNKYKSSFCAKCYSEENNDYDILMQVFGISPDLKRENRQYWGRELGMLWQCIIVDTFQNYAPSSYKPAIKLGQDEPCDLVVANYAIDTKYRVGSGDSGTLKKFKTYGPLLKEMGFQPVMLFLREDNLAAAVTACEAGGWEIYTGLQTFTFILKHSGFDLQKALVSYKNKYTINR